MELKLYFGLTSGRPCRTPDATTLNQSEIVPNGATFLKNSKLWQTFSLPPLSVSIYRACGETRGGG